MSLVQTTEALSGPVQAPVRYDPLLFISRSPLEMQRCDWTLAARQEERAAVLRPKTHTQAGSGQRKSVPVGGMRIFSV